MVLPSLPALDREKGFMFSHASLRRVEHKILRRAFCLFGVVGLLGEAFYPARNDVRGIRRRVRTLVIRWGILMGRLGRTAAGSRCDTYINAPSTGVMFGAYSYASARLSSTLNSNSIDLGSPLRRYVKLPELSIGSSLVF